MPQVQIKNGPLINFPDSMSQDQIRQALQKKYPISHPVQTPSLKDKILSVIKAHPDLTEFVSQLATTLPLAGATEGASLLGPAAETIAKLLPDIAKGVMGLATGTELGRTINRGVAGQPMPLSQVPGEVGSAITTGAEGEVGGRSIGELARMVKGSILTPAEESVIKNVTETQGLPITTGQIPGRSIQNMLQKTGAITFMGGRQAIKHSEKGTEAFMKRLEQLRSTETAGNPKEAAIHLQDMLEHAKATQSDQFDEIRKTLGLDGVKGIPHDLLETVRTLRPNAITTEYSPGLTKILGTINREIPPGKTKPVSYTTLQSLRTAISDQLKDATGSEKSYLGKLYAATSQSMKRMAYDAGKGPQSDAYNQAYHLHSQMWNNSPIIQRMMPVTNRSISKLKEEIHTIPKTLLDNPEGANVLSHALAFDPKSYVKDILPKMGVSLHPAGSIGDGEYMGIERTPLEAEGNLRKMLLNASENSKSHRSNILKVLPDLNKVKMSAVLHHPSGNNEPRDLFNYLTSKSMPVESLTPKIQQLRQALEYLKSYNSTMFGENPSGTAGALHRLSTIEPIMEGVSSLTVPHALPAVITGETLSGIGMKRATDQTRVKDLINLLTEAGSKKYVDKVTLPAKIGLTGTLDAINGGK
jgi:hypothetical protein